MCVGGDSFAVTVTDADGFTSKVAVSVTVTAAVDDGDATLTLSSPVEEGTAVSVASLAGDPDGDGAITGYI